MDYATIKALSVSQKIILNDLIALAKSNDPFFCGSETDIKKAQWFKNIWDKFDCQSGTHIRRSHYRLI